MTSSLSYPNIRYKWPFWCCCCRVLLSQVSYCEEAVSTHSNATNNAGNVGIALCWDNQFPGRHSWQEERAGWMPALCQSPFLLGRPRHTDSKTDRARGPWHGQMHPLPPLYGWRDQIAASSCQDRSRGRWNEVPANITFVSVKSDSLPRARTIPISQISVNAVTWVRRSRKMHFGSLYTEVFFWAD